MQIFIKKQVKMHFFLQKICKYEKKVVSLQSVLR